MKTYYILNKDDFYCVLQELPLGDDPDGRMFGRFGEYHPCLFKVCNCPDNKMDEKRFCPVNCMKGKLKSQHGW